LLDDDFINITGFAHVDANGEVRIDQADLHALSDLLEEYERNRGGPTPQDPVLDPDPAPAPVCDNEQTWNELYINGYETVYDYLHAWFNKFDPPTECVTDDYLIWMLENNDCLCADLQRWMIKNLSYSYTIEELREDVEARFPRDDVKYVLFDTFFSCFWREDLQLKYTDAEINADVIRSLMPIESDICPRPHTPVWPPAEQLCPYPTNDPGVFME